jgi:hypothetical protein
MWKHVELLAITIAVIICGTLLDSRAAAQQVLASFEQTLVSSADNVPFEGTWVASPDYTPTGATDGANALAVHHSPTWLTEGLFLKAGLPLAEQAAQHDFMLIDLTTTDLGLPADGWSPSWRQVFVVFNASPEHGGWQQNQIDFPVAADDGTSLTYTAVLDLVSSGIKANAQSFVETGGGPNTWWELFLIFQGGDQGTVVKTGDYNNDNIVDAADYVIWRKNLNGTSLPNETASLGIVDGEDYTEWQRAFGTDYSKITSIIDNIRFANAGSGAGAAPEPSSAVLMLVASLAVAGCGRRVFRG